MRDTATYIQDQRCHQQADGATLYPRSQIVLNGFLDRMTLIDHQMQIGCC